MNDAETTNTPQHEKIHSSLYDHKYYLESMEGAEEFSRSRGEILPKRMDYALKLGNIQAGQRVVISCGDIKGSGVTNKLKILQL